MAGAPERRDARGSHVQDLALAGLDVKTAFDKVQSSTLAGILKETGVHGWILASLLEETKDLKDMASFESCSSK